MSSLVEKFNLTNNASVSMLLENQLEMSFSKAVSFLKKTKMQGGQRRFKSSRSLGLNSNNPLKVIGLCV